jgi:hypothetical protein
MSLTFEPLAWQEDYTIKTEAKAKPYKGAA